MNLSRIILMLSVGLFFWANTQAQTIAYSGAGIIVGDGSIIHNGVLIVNGDGTIEACGPVEEVDIRADEVIDLTGKFIMPGIINTHGHVGDVKGIDPGHYSVQNIKDQLKRYAYYGVTTVVSLGGDRQDAVPLRDVNYTGKPEGARLYIAGGIVDGKSPSMVREQVDANVDMGVDFIKIRVDDNLGTSDKMSPEVYKAAIDRAHHHDKMMAAHMFYLDDAKLLLNAGADYLAHSVRDKEVDSEFIRMIKNTDACYCPTLARDLSTFIYETKAFFFEDPFFLEAYDASIFQPLMSKESMERVKNSKSAQAYKDAIQIALKNLKTLSNAGVPIAFGTDSGVAKRFQGYFEHMEMNLMAQAGLGPETIIKAATGDAAKCMKMDHIGILSAGKDADFLVLQQNPHSDIRAMRSIEQVFVKGVSVR